MEEESDSEEPVIYTVKEPVKFISSMCMYEISRKDSVQALIYPDILNKYL